MEKDQIIQDKQNDGKKESDQAKPSEDTEKQLLPKPSANMTAEEKDQVKAYIKERVAKNKVNDCDKYIKESDELFDYFIQQMSTNKNAKRGSEIVVKYKKDFANYPELVERLEKKAVRFMLGDQTWELVELRLRPHPRLLAMAAEDYFYRGNKDLAYTLVVNNNLTDLIKKDDLKNWLKSEEAAMTQVIVNSIVAEDKFSIYV